MIKNTTVKELVEYDPQERTTFDIQGFGTRLSEECNSTYGDLISVLTKGKYKVREEPVEPLAMVEVQQTDGSTRMEPNARYTREKILFQEKFKVFAKYQAAQEDLRPKFFFEIKSRLSSMSLTKMRSRTFLIDGKTLTFTEIEESEDPLTLWKAILALFMVSGEDEAEMKVRALEDLFDASQGEDESFPDFVERFKVMRKRVEFTGQTLPDDAILAAKFIRGLNSNFNLMKEKFRSGELTRPAKVDDAQAFILSHFPSAASGKGPSSTVYGAFTEKKSVNVSAPAPAPASAPVSTSAPSSTSKRVPKEERICETCGVKGHYGIRCPIFKEFALKNKVNNQSSIYVSSSFKGCLLDTGAQLSLFPPHLVTDIRVSPVTTEFSSF